MDKSNKENILNEKVENFDVLQQKDSVKSTALGSHGMKLSVNMTSQDKKEFLLKLEEWRKARREKLVNNVPPKNKEIVKSSKLSSSSLPLRNKSNEISVFDNKIGEIETSEKKESVFERLYKNAKRVRKPQISGEVFKKPTGLDVIKTNKPLGLLQNKALNKSSYQANKINISFKTDSCLPSTKEVDSEINNEIQHQLSVNEMVKADQSNDVSCLSENNESIQMELEKESSDKQNEMQVNNEKYNNCGELSSGETKPQIPVHSNCLEETHLINEKFDEPIKTQGFHLKSDGEKSLQTDVDLTNKNLNFIPITETSEREKSERKIHLANINILSEKQGMKKVRESAKHQTSLRRSISMIHRKRCKMSSATMQKSLSERSLHEIKSSYHYSAKGLNVKSVSRPATSSSLRIQLEEWLKLNGHSLEGYRHLRCFDIANDGKNSLRHTSIKPNKSDSFSKSTCNDTLSKSSGEDGSQENICDVENWLKELYRLIVEVKYPSDRCEEWLSAIKKNYEDCDKSYLYWECVAALDESKSNGKSAVAKNAEVDEVADSLTELFDKMVIEQQKPLKTKIERGLDVKNIFKSTVIKFALQEKTVKELDSKLGEDVQQQHYVATPVRRSSRIKTPCKSHVVSSLHSVTPEVRRNLTFKPNDSLID